MEYSIQPSNDGSYILLTVKGEIDRTRAIQYNLEAHALGERLGIASFLVDLTEAYNTDNVVQTYQFAYKDMQHTPGINRSACVALLVSPGDHSHDFIETVARNTGQDVTLFTDRDQAVRHLSGKQHLAD